MDNLELYAQIFDLRDKLNKSDYKIMKYIEGKLTEQEYTSIKAQRQEWRDEINRLEAQLKGE